MSDFDLERLGDVWRQQPDPAELEALRRTAETVRRRARWANLIDHVAAFVVAGVVLLLVISNPRPDTFLVGGGAILILLISQYRNRRLRQEELRSLRGSAEEMLDQSIRRVEGTIKRARYQIMGLVPGGLVGLAVAFVTTGGPEPSVVREALSGMFFLVATIALGSVAAMLIHLARTIRRGRAELARLKTLRAAYSQESESGEQG